jgi:hypothetical protein
MTNVNRFAIPLALAAVAGAANFAVFSRMTKQVEVLVVAEKVPEGTRITKEHLRAVKVRAEPTLLQSVVRAEESGSAVGRVARRPLAAGELVLRADVVEEQVPTPPPGQTYHTVVVHDRRAAVFAGETVVAMVRYPAGRVPDAAPEKLGPYRVVYSSRVPGDRENPLRKLVLASAADDTAVHAFKKAFDTDRARTEAVLSVEKTGATALTDVRPANKTAAPRNGL